MSTLAPETAEQQRTVVSGRYEVLETLGAGGFGVVHKAWDRNLHRTVAIKVIRMEALVAGGARRDEVVKRFEREATTAAGLTHPGIVTVYDIGTTGGAPYLAMEYVDSVGLDRIIAGEGHLPAEQAALIALEVAEALEYAHAHGVLHRDVKPPNIVVPRSGARPVKLVDFGLAKALDCTEHLTRTGTFLGTPAYASPEQIGGEAVDGRSDLWSVGCVLYEMLTGQRAFQGRSITSLVVQIMTAVPPPVRELDPCVPEELARIVARAMAKDPAVRYGSATDLVSDLRRFVRSRAAAAAAAALLKIAPAETVNAIADATTIVPPPAAPAQPTMGVTPAPAAVVTPVPRHLGLLRSLVPAALLTAGVGVAVMAPGRDAAVPAPMTPAVTAPPAAAPLPASPASTVAASDRVPAVSAAAVASPAPAAPPPVAGERKVAANRPPSAAQGYMRITSQPPGARVTIDGYESAVTPQTSALESGRHTILVVRDGHVPWSADVSIVKGRTTTVDAFLEAAVAPPPPSPAEDRSRVYGPGEVDAQPERIALDLPVYPRGAPPLRKGQILSVTLSYVVSVDGSISDVSVVKSSRVRVVDEAVAAAARRSRYRPGTKSGVPVAARVFHSFSFRGG